MPQFSCAQLAGRLDGSVVGDSDLILSGFAPADSAKPGDLTFADRALHHAMDELRDLRAVERAAVAFLANCLLG